MSGDRLLALQRLAMEEAVPCHRCRALPRITVHVDPEHPPDGSPRWLVVRGTCRCPHHRQPEHPPVPVHPSQPRPASLEFDLQTALLDAVDGLVLTGRAVDTHALSCLAGREDLLALWSRLPPGNRRHVLISFAWAARNAALFSVDPDVDAVTARLQARARHEARTRMGYGDWLAETTPLAPTPLGLAAVVVLLAGLRVAYTGGESECCPMCRHPLDDRDGQRRPGPPRPRTGPPGKALAPSRALSSVVGAERHVR